MENNERDRKLDQWLDEALSQFSAAEPRLGLEQRVLAHVRAEEQARAGRRTWWRWMPAFAAIAAVLVVMVAVRPYWDQKRAQKQPSQVETFSKPQTSKTEAMSGEKNTLEDAKQAAPVSDASSRASARVPRPVLETSGGAPKREAVAQPSEQMLSAARDKGEANSITKKDLRQAVAAKQDEYSKQTDHRLGYSARMGSTSNVAGVTGGVVNKPVPSAAAASVQPATPLNRVVVQTEALEVPSAAVPVQTQSGIIATEKLAAMPDVSARVKAMKANAKAPAAKSQNENGDTVNVLGMTTLRTDIKSVPPGPIQQFPTPVPLSKEEKLMLAASKQLKGKPATEEKNDGEINAIEIKKIEIAPLPGPEK